MTTLSDWTTGVTDLNSIAAGSISTSKLVVGTITPDMIKNKETPKLTKWLNERDRMIQNVSYSTGIFADRINVEDETVEWVVAVPGLDKNDITVNVLEDDLTGDIVSIEVVALGAGFHYDQGRLTKVLSVPEAGNSIYHHDLKNGVLTIGIQRPYTKYALDL